MSRRVLTVPEMEALSSYLKQRVRWCTHCGRPFLPGQEYGQRTIYCSAACAATIKAGRRRNPTAKVRGDGTVYYGHTCSHCQQDFASRRVHSQYCSGRCRVAAHRKRGATPP